MQPFEDDPDPSPIGNGIVDVLDATSRIRKPVVRKSWLDNGPGSSTHLRGVEPFVEVSWDQAERLVAEELTRVKTSYGNSAIYAGSYGWAQCRSISPCTKSDPSFLKVFWWLYPVC